MHRGRWGPAHLESGAAGNNTALGGIYRRGTHRRRTDGVTTYTAPRRGVSLTGMGGVALAFIVTLAGGAFDLLTGTGLRRGFAIALVIGAVLAALLVRLSDLFTVVVSPPVIYMLVSVLATIPNSNGAFHSKARLSALLANWLVYGFPEMATATGLAIVIAIVRRMRS